MLKSSSVGSDHNAFSDVDGGNLEMFGEAELAVGLQILGSKNIVLLLGPHHHGSVLVGRPLAQCTLEAGLVEHQVRHQHRILGVGLEIMQN